VARRRLDAELVRRGLADSRERARELVASGAVTVGGAVADKPSRQVDPADAIAVRASGPSWASRGAQKLAGALDHFAHRGLASPQGRRCLDAGASTGGFTDVLLAAGAEGVIAVDVGYGQLRWRLQQDPRVTVRDRTNVRHLQLDDLPWQPDLVVADLSFISLATVLPALARCISGDGDMVLMVKPQFEVGRERVGKSGVVRDPHLRGEAIAGVCGAAAELGWGAAGVTASPLPGPSGNVEYFVWLRRDAAGVTDDEIRTAIAEGPD
jgi:23S rRNA (cytidine1920-2'-O)/16S rRNA (cytidine1409-2'-O)-methyltransferase